MRLNYLFFHSEDLEKIVASLKGLKPKFKKFKRTEILASNHAVMGKYRNVGFVVSKEDLSIPCECLGKFTVELSTADDTFEIFKYGRYKLEDEVLKIDAKFSEELFYDYLPALLIEIITIRTLINECNLIAEKLSDEEKAIILRISKLSQIAKSSSDISELEEILSEITSYHTDFFNKFVKFKDVNEELFSAVTRIRNIGRELSLNLVEYRDAIDRLRYFESKFEQTLIGIRDLYTLISIRLDALRNREYLELLRRTSSLQAAAAVIEFVAVFYYTLKIWDYFMPIDKLPEFATFGLLTVFTALIVLYTEALSEIIRNRKVSKKFVVLTVLLTIVVGLMIATPSLGAL